MGQICFFDAAAYFGSVAAADSFMAMAIKATSLLKQEYEKEYSEEAPIFDFTLALMHHWFPDEEDVITRALAASVSYRFRHGLDDTVGEA